MTERPTMIIPQAALEQHIAVLGKNGSGKTYATKAVIVEPLLEAGKHVALVDPTSAWWGLRSSASGKGPGFKVIVLGGDHGDLPLPVRGGEAVARLVVEQRVNVIVDTGNFSVGERTRWMIDFAGTIYRLNRTPLYLILDEAHVFAPQSGGGRGADVDANKMLHAVNQLASGGRSRGIRLTMITQRPQKLHKDALTTADTLIAMRVIAPHDREAVKAWIDGCGDPAQGKQVLDSLAQLKRGEGWVWYPEGGHLVKVKFPAIKTFDSSATPTDGGTVAAPKGAAEVDLTEIRAALADAVKEAEANDPKLLRAEVARLKAEAAKKAAPASDLVAIAAARHEGREEGSHEGYAAGLRAMHPFMERLATLTSALGEHVDGYHADLQKLTAKAPVRQMPVNRPTASRPQAAPQRAPAGPGQPLAKAERLILTALAQYPQGRTSVQVAVLTGYAHGGGGFRNAMGALRTAGRLEGGSERLTITQAGLEDLGPFDPLPSGPALLQHWYSQLSRAECKSLEALAEAYPSSLTAAQIANRAGYDAEGGGFRNALGRLRTLELIRGRRDITASSDLFQA